VNVSLLLSRDCRAILVGIPSNPGEKPLWSFPTSDEVASGFISTNRPEAAAEKSRAFDLQLFRLAENQVVCSFKTLMISNSVRIRWISAKQFWEEIQSSSMNFSRQLLELISEPEIPVRLIRLWSAAMSERRAHLLQSIRKSSKAGEAGVLDENSVVNLLLPRPAVPAREFDVNAVFSHGTDACPGAYRISEMASVAEGIELWQSKLLDPYHRYVREELHALRGAFHSATEASLPKREEVEDAENFIWDILNFPLSDGSILRDDLGNLEELAAVRNALKLHLQGRYAAERVESPLGAVNAASNVLVAEIFRRQYGQHLDTSDAFIGKLLILNVLMNALDFHSPDFRGSWDTPESLLHLIERQFKAADTAILESTLGGETFVAEFLAKWLRIDDSDSAHLVYLSDNNGQLVVSLKCIEAFLRRRSTLRITLVPKQGHYGNDASIEDVSHVLESDATNQQPLFSYLREMLGTGRFSICREGPMMQGLDPRRLSQELCRQLQGADVILAEGQAHAEIRGWMKPTYLLFQVKGRVAEAIHGIERRRKALAFVRVGNGVEHYSHLERLPNRRISARSKEDDFHAYGQTTRDYVEAVVSQNYATMRDGLFYGREATLVSRLREESARSSMTLAEIVLGTPVPAFEEMDLTRRENPPEVFVIGGGGGMNAVTLKALQDLGVSVVAGVPSTDDGGSTGKLQQMLQPSFGYLFGVGDAAAILEQSVKARAKKPVLSFRPNETVESLSAALIKHIRHEIRQPTMESRNLSECPDFLAFVCEQLNLARIIDEHFLGSGCLPGFTVRGSSIRNLNILAAFHRCGAISTELGLKNPLSATDSRKAERAWFWLEKLLDLHPERRGNVRPLPVSYDQGVLWAEYDQPIPEEEIQRLKIPESALAKASHVVFGQKYIDQIVTRGRLTDFGLVGAVGRAHVPLPQPNPDYVKALRASKLVVMGAGSLFGSQLAQLAIPGIVEEIAKKKDSRRVLVMNHVCMNETAGYSLGDHIKAIERLAASVAWGDKKPVPNLRIGDLFTDIIVPRTVAREIDEAIKQESKTPKNPRDNPARECDCTPPSSFVRPDGQPATVEAGIFRNHYVDFVLNHPDFRAKHQITDWELRVLGFLEQPAWLYENRREAGRYRGAVYATDEDTAYIESRGINRRHIYEVESIAINEKILKAEGKPVIEKFPGLIPESLVGIFKILLQKGA
jgi:2-phospho-L-lactate transferase/gluconeogenesis factor (CofD/UPF0052 family)